MFINIKNFNYSSVIGEDNISVKSNTAIELVLNPDFSEGSKFGPIIEFPQYDCKAMKEEGKKLYDKCVAIGVKDDYTKEELDLINDFFAFSTLVNLIDPNVSHILHTENLICDMVSPDSPSTIATFTNYYVGFETIIKGMLFKKVIKKGTNLTITLDVASLTQSEAKAFVSYLKKATYDTFNLCLYGSK